MKDFDWSQGYQGEAKERVQALISALAEEVFPDEYFGGDIERIVQRFRERSQELMPPESVDLTTHRKIASHGAGVMITVIENVASDALYERDYHKALEVGNHLYFYGELAYQDNLQSLAYIQAVGFHSEFAHKVLKEFGDRDSYLQRSGEIAFKELEVARVSKDHHRELEIARGIVHSVALNGTLGDKAKRAVDPLAIVSQFRP